MLHFSSLLLLAASLVASVAAAPVAAPVAARAVPIIQEREPTNLYVSKIIFDGDPDAE